jgi:hypothetical protein
MALSFPTGPTSNDQYTAGDNIWYWDGTKWRTFGSVLGPIGPAGVTGGSTNDLPKITAVTYTDAAFVTSANTSLLSGTAGYVKLTGSNFSSYSTVYVNNTKATTTYVSSTQLNVVLPAASAGTYNIYLYNTNNGSCTVKAAGVAYASAKAYGGILSNSGSYSVHAFTSSGTFITTQSLTVDYLIVAGGGSAGAGASGSGGGAGGVRLFTSQTLSAGTYSIVVGGGGGASYIVGGINGNDSSAFGYTSTGGGNGASSYTALVAGSGGSGGGASSGSGTYGNPGTGTYVGGSGNTPSTSPVQGYRGGHITVSSGSTGGGGGAGSTGGDVTVDGTPGDGGSGVYISQFDMYGTDASNVASGSSGRGYYGGGGAGKSGATNGTPGVGGGASDGVVAKINTGGGGAGGRQGYVISYSLIGASGIVLVRYLT